MIRKKTNKRITLKTTRLFKIRFVQITKRPKCNK